VNADALIADLALIACYGLGWVIVIALWTLLFRWALRDWRPGMRL